MEESIPQKTSKKYIIGIIIAAVIIGGSLVYIKYYKKNNPLKVIPAQEAADKAIKYINEKILGGQSAVSLTGVSEENGVYKIKFTLNEKEITSYVTRNGKILFPTGYDLTEVITAVEKTIGDFSISQENICEENGKPIVYFFGSKGCPHCTWEKPIIESVIAKFAEKVSFHSNIDTDTDKEIFSKYSTGGIPTLVIGCRYYRVGSGENVGEDQETKNLTAMICKLTNSQPGDVCSQVQDLINQVK